MCVLPTDKNDSALRYPSRGVGKNALYGAVTRIPSVDLDKYIKIDGFVSTQPPGGLPFTSLRFVGIGAHSHLLLERLTDCSASLGQDVYLPAA